MSFFDDDEPIRASRTRPARPRTPAPAGARGGGGGGSRRPPARTGRPDPATARQRQLILGGAALLVFIILVFLVSSCRSNAKEQALKDYNRSVTEIATDSTQLSTDFFAALDAAASSNVQVRINALRVTADELVDRAGALEPRDELARAQAALELTLNLRAQALRKIGEKLPRAQVSGRDNAQSAETAGTQIAGQMEQFLASDVIYSQRVAPYIREALQDADVTGQRITVSRFLPNLAWLQPDTIFDRLDSPRAAGGQGANAEPAPGLHGHSLTSVAVGSKALQPGTTTNSVPARPAPTFTVKFANGGDSAESDVVVTATVRVNGKATSKKKTITQTKAKAEDISVSIPLGSSPPPGAATLTVTIAKVPGEEETANNKQTYTILFTQ